MSDAPLQPAPTLLRAKDVYETFIALCVNTRGAFEAACAAAAVRQFEFYNDPSPVPRDASKVLAEARFRRPGFFFTATKHAVERPGQPAYQVQDLVLLARPASFNDVVAALKADLREPTSTNATPGVEWSFAGDLSTAPLLARGDSGKQLEKSGGEVTMIRAWEVRPHPSQPGDAVAVSYQRWMRSPQ